MKGRRGTTKKNNLSETASAGIASIQALNVAPILDFLKEASGAILDKKSQDFLIASQQFFSAVAEVQAELKE